jgi:hypothetical protein
VLLGVGHHVFGCMAQYILKFIISKLNPDYDKHPYPSRKILRFLPSACNVLYASFALFDIQDCLGIISFFLIFVRILYRTEIKISFFDLSLYSV